MPSRLSRLPTLLGAVTALAVTLAGLLVVGADASGAPRRAAATALALGDDHINRVLAISVDGLNPDAIRHLGAEGAPNLHRLMAEGVSTLNARTAWESTSTLPNHAGMLTSRRVNARRGGHGVDFNNDDDKTTVHRAAGRYVPSIFDIVHDRGRATALYTSKDKFALYNRSWNRRNGAPDRTGRDNGRDKIDTYRYREDEDVLVDMVLDDLADGAAPFTFLHLSSTDKVGHAQGYMGEAYISQVRTVDALLGRLLEVIDATPKLQASLAVVLTSDHGGLRHNHSDPRQPVNYTVPFVVWGNGVAAGADLYAMNPAYADPEGSRPTYATEPQPVRNGVVANLAADLLDLPRLPGARMNSERNLLVMAEQE